MTHVENALKWGTGVLNIDGCRILLKGESPTAKRRRSGFALNLEKAKDSERRGKVRDRTDPTKKAAVHPSDDIGRWPANLIIDRSVAILLDEQSGNRKGWSSQKHNSFNPYGGNALLDSETEREGFYEGYNDEGGASRFFYNVDEKESVMLRKKRDTKIMHHLGDVLEKLEDCPDNVFDACFCDPPYHLVQISRGGSPQPGDMNTPQGRSGPSKQRKGGFMGKTWDGGTISFDPKTWRGVYRVLKPGAYLLAFGGTRTWHRLACAIEDAGFKIRDTLMFLYGSGFPKSLDISKNIDKSKGLERETVGEYKKTENYTKPYAGEERDDEEWGRASIKITAPVLDEAKQWDGYGTGLKPAWEPIIVAMKPLEGTYVQNALEHGTGGLNIDDSRLSPAKSFEDKRDDEIQKNCYGKYGTADYDESEGRWPANLILQHHSDCKQIGVKKVKGCKIGSHSNKGIFGWSSGMDTSYVDKDGNELVDEWECHPDCPVSMLDEQSGISSNCGYRINKNGNLNSKKVYGGGVHTKGWNGPKDKGGASRFFYCSKASSSERNAGLDDFVPEVKTEKYAGRDTKCTVCGKYFLSGDNPCTCDPEIHGPKSERMENPESFNNHPCCKPLDLCRYISTLILPPKRVDDKRKLLIPFSGSGSEMVGAMLAGWDEVHGIETDKDYVDISKARIEYWRYHKLSDPKPKKFVDKRMPKLF